MHSRTTTSTPATTATTRAGARRGRQPRDVPTLIFRIIAFAMATFVLAGPGGAAYLPAPWRIVGEPDPTVPFELHRWHVTDITALVALLLVGALLASATTPRRSVPAGQTFLAGIATLATAATFVREPGMILVPCVVLTGIFLATYPNRRGLLGWHREPRSRITVAAAALATPYLVTDIVHNVHLQLVDTSQHADMGHWAIGAALSTTLLLAGWLAATGGRTAQPLSTTLAVTYLYLGLAALSIPHHDGSWSTTGGILALVLAGGFMPSVGRRPAVGRDRP
jgi:hypothetical protein